MKTSNFNFLTKSILFLFIIALGNTVFCQVVTAPKTKNIFWEHVQFGGGLGLGVGSGYTDITVAPSAIYNFNRYVSLGLGLQGSFIKVKNDFSSIIYGANAIGLFNPIEKVQLSLEVEQVRVHTTSEALPEDFKRNFWNTAFFVGAGYRTENVTFGARYNLLFDKDKSIYSVALMPFVRVYF